MYFSVEGEVAEEGKGCEVVVVHTGKFKLDGYVFEVGNVSGGVGADVDGMEGFDVVSPKGVLVEIK